MPLYPYRCRYCNHSFEVKKPIEASSYLERCPECGARADRVFTSVPFSFGWRLTDRSHERFGPRDEVEKDV